MKAAERWSEHTKRLPPLKVGDTVRIQNQTGPFPIKWDKTGRVVEVRQFDQYVVRVDGSGRVTLRNRKFLRKYVPVYPSVLPSDDLKNLTPPPSYKPNYKSDVDQPTASTLLPPSDTHSDAPKLPTQPDATTHQPPSTHNDPHPESQQSTMPRMLRMLQTHNNPGLNEHPIQTEQTNGPLRRSQRLNEQS